MGKCLVNFLPARVFPALVLVSGLALSTGNVSADTIIRVAAGSNAASPDGSTWAKAYPTLQEAISKSNPSAANPVEIWIKAGVYKPTTNSDRGAAFFLKSYMRLRGGFQGVENNLNERTPLEQAFLFTVLSGDIGGVQPDAITDTNAGRDPSLVSYDPATAQASDNSYNLLYAENVANVVLDRLVVSGGHSDNDAIPAVNVDGMLYPALGDYIPGDPDGFRIAQFRNGPDRRTNGAGLFVINANVIVNGCKFIGNYARGLGGGISVRDGSIDLQNSQLVRNVAGLGGGALSLQNATAPNLRSNNFYGNASAVMGGAVYVQDPVTSQALITYITTAIESLSAMTFEDFDLSRNAKLNYDYMRLVKSGSAVALAIIKAALVPKLIQTFGTRAIIALSASATPLTLAYGLTSFAVLLGDLGAEIAKAFGVDPNDPGIKAWTKFSTNFAAYATPDGLAQSFFNAFYDGPTFAERATPIRNNDYQANHNKAVPIKFIGNVFEQNHSTGVGGALVAIRSNVLISQSSVIENSSAFGGGAFGFFGYNNGEVENSVMRGNSSLRGASVALVGYRSVSRFINDTIIDNHSDSANGYALNGDAGADINVANSILWRNTNGDVNNTENPNRAGGADVFATRYVDLPPNGKEDYDKAKDSHGLYTATADIQYCNIESLARLPSGGEIFDSYPSYLFTPYLNGGILVESSRPNVGEGIATVANRGNISLNPMLVDQIYPHPFSPVVNAGSDAVFIRGETKDVQGVVRKTGGNRIDIGAVESNGALPAGTILHVDANASANGNGLGLDWNNAIRNLQDALKIPLSPGGQIWVATGDYVIPPGFENNATFMELAPGCSLIGGFSPSVGATTMAQRNPETFPVNISGTGGAKVLLRGLTTLPVTTGNHINRDLITYPRVIDGLKFRSANTGGIASAVQLAVPAVVKSCVFENIRGGRALSISDPGLFYSYASGQIIDSTFTSNNGGAVACHAYNLDVIRSQFYNNEASGGAAIYKYGTNSQDSFLLERNTFYSNISGNGGGAVVYEGSSLVAAHNVFASNSFTDAGPTLSPYGGAGLTWRNILPAGNYPRKYQIVNNIFYGNRISGSALSIEYQQCDLPTYTPTFVQRIITGNAIEGLNNIAPREGSDGNVDFDPGFTNAAAHDFSLKADSYLSNNGVDYQSASDSTTINGGFRDIGVVEGAGTTRRSLATLTQTVEKPTESGRSFTLKAQNFDVPPTNVTWEVFRPGSAGFVTLSPDANHSATTYNYSYPGGVQTIGSVSITITNPPHTLGGSVYRVRYSSTGYSNGVTLQPAPSILYVDSAKNGDGTSWASAFKTLPGALAIAQPYTQIWVRQGTHVMSNSDVPPGTRIYGGFSGSESSLAQRNPQLYPSVFVFPDNAMLQLNGTATWPGDSSAIPTVFDSLKFTHPSTASHLLWFRNADARLNACNFAQFSSSAVYSYQSNLSVSDSIFNECGNSPLYVINSTLNVSGSSFTRNQNNSNGGAIVLYGTTATISDSRFTENRGNQGGAISLSGGYLDLQRSRFLDNSANIGGAIYQGSSSSSRIANSLFARNRSGSNPGGAIAHYSGGLSVVQSTFVDNSSGNAGGAIMTLGGLSLTNSIVWGNTAGYGNGGIYGSFSLTNSHVQGQGTAGFSPLFNPSSTDYALSANSPLLNRGGSDTALSGSTDLAGLSRVFGSAADLGASEFQATAGTPLYFTTPPASQTIYADRPVTFSLVGNSGSLTGPALAFTWEYLNGSFWAPISNYPGWTNNAGTLSFTKVSQAMDGLQLRATATGFDTLPPVTLTVIPRKVIRVDGRVASAGDGSTWTVAYKTIASALAAADGDTDLWIAGGDYPETALTAPSGAKIFVGFAGNEVTVAGRDPVARPVRLAGSASYVTLLPDSTLALPDFGFHIVSPPAAVTRYVDRPIAFSARSDGSTRLGWEYLSGSSWLPISNLPGWTTSNVGETNNLSFASAQLSQNGLQIRAITPGTNEASFTTQLTVKPRSILYVKATGTTPPLNGSSWAHAFPTIAAALAVADDGSDIWIAGGNYNESELRHVPGTNLYGGFAGGETDVNARNIATHPVRLVGDGTSFDFPQNPVNSFRYTLAGAPRIRALYSGQSGSLAINLTGSGIPIQWQYRDNNVWKPIDGVDGWVVTSTSLSSKLVNNALPLSANGMAIRVIVPSVGEISSTVTLSVQPRPILYVKTAGTQPPFDGSSWDHAFSTLTAALTAADDGSNIWIAAGTYQGTHVVKSGVRIYGGFVGTEGPDALADRNPAAHPVTLTSTGDASILSVDLSAAEFDLLTLIDGVTVAGHSTAVPAASLNGRSISFDNVTFYGAPRAVFLEGSTTFAEFNDCFFHDNAEAIVSASGPAVVVSDSTFSHNIHALTFADGSALAVTGSNFDQSSAWAISAPAGLNLEDSHFSSNFRDVIVTGTGTALTRISESTFTDTIQSAITSATPLALASSQFTGVHLGVDLTDGATASIVSNSSFTSGSDAVRSPAGLTVTNTTFTGNARGLAFSPSGTSVSTVTGGSFANQTIAGIQSAGAINLSGVTFTGNATGLDLSASAEISSVANGTFTGNTTGIISVSGLTVTNGSFTNEVNGISITGGSFGTAVENTTFTGLTGTGIVSASRLSTEEVTFTNCALGVSLTGGSGISRISNTTFTGGVSGLSVETQARAEVVDSLFTQLSGTAVNASGAALANNVYNVQFTDTTFHENTGPVFNSTSGAYKFDRATITNNSAPASLMVSGGGSLFLLNSLVAQNTATTGGSTLRSNGGAISIGASTIADNETGNVVGAVAGSIYNIRQSILWGNRASGTLARVDLMQADQQNTRVSLTIIEGVQPLSWQQPAERNLPIDPLFADPGSGDYRLHPLSPAIDAAGSSFAGSVLDLAGADRIQSAAMDFGAYESSFTRAANPLLIGLTSGPRTIVTGDATTYAVNFATGNGRAIKWQVDDGSGNFVDLAAGAGHSSSYANGVFRLTVEGDPSLSGNRYRAVITANGEEIYKSPASTFTVVSRPVYYVDATATGNGSGSDWQNAYTSLNTALTNAVAFSDINVAKGTYRAPANDSFDLRRRQRLIGGWNPATGTRDVSANQTILSSAVGAPSTSVILATNADQGVVDNLTTVDGFTFTSGGIGLQLPQASPVVRNCRFENLATGIYLAFGQLTLEDSSFTGQTRSAIIVYGQDSELAITGCSFLNNIGGIAGAGAIALGDTSSNTSSGVQRAYIADSIFRGNTGVRGGAISLHISGTSVEIAGCEFTDNIATEFGAAIYGNSNNSVSVRQSLFARNQAAEGAAIYCSGSASFIFSTIANNRVTGVNGSAIQVTNGLTLRDSIVWGNTTSGTYLGQRTQILPSNVAGNFSDSIIQDFKDASGTRLLPFDPKFTDAANGNFTLAANSPAIGIAQAADLLSGETDLTGLVRPAGAAADLGAYESAATPAPVYAFSTLPPTLSGYGGTNLTLTQSVPVGYTGVWEYFNGTAWIAFPVLGQGTGGPAGALSSYYIDLGVRQATLQLQQITSALNGTQVRYVLNKDGSRYESAATTVTVTSFEAIYVDASVSTSGNGLSWSAAFKTLHEGLAAVTTTRRVIYVAKGTYRGPFPLPMRFEMYGGFPQGGGLLADRNPSANEVILTGLPAVTGDARASAVVRFLYSGSNYTQPILDGVTIENGQTGILAETNVAPVLRKLIVRGNTNSGVILPSAGAIIEDSIFESNSGINGGGIQANNASTLERVILRGNSATRGGGAYLLGNSVLRNVLVSGNVATTAGGLSISGLSPRLDQVTIAGNRAVTGPAIYSDYGPAALRNSIVWGNRTPADVTTTQLAASGTLSSFFALDHTIVERSSLTTGVLAFNPLFNASATAASAPSIAGDYILNALSPAIDAGSDTLASGITTDLAGHARFTGTVDLGAYESATTASSTLAVTNESDSLFFNYNLVGNTFSVTAPAASSIVWQYALPGSSDWATLVGVSGFSGANTGTLTVTAANTAFNGYRVRAVLTAANGGTATLEERTLTVYPPHLFVDANRTGSQPEDGLTWATAYRSLDSAIAAVPTNPEAAEIWVADGIYTPSTVFNVRAGIAIYGGFAGNETELAQRNPSLNVTALVGKTGQTAIVSIPASPANTTPIRLDSLSIRDLSNTTGAGINDESGRPLIVDRVRFTGLPFVAIRASNANVTIRSSEFRGNGSPTGFASTVTFGGSGGSILIENTLFAGNSTSGGAFNTSAPTILRNVTIAHNFGSSAFSSYTNNIGMYGCVIWGNRGSSNQSSVPNSIYGSTARNCVTENVIGLEYFFTSRSGNIDADPKFTAPVAVTSTPTTAGDYSFGANSGAIDRGYNDDVSSPALDLAGNPRQHGLFIDIGAYEYQGDDVYTLATQPVDKSTTAGPATLSVTTTNSRPASYVWERSENGGETYSSITGATNASLVVAGSAAVHDDLYRVRVQFANGPLVVSNAAKISHLVANATAGLPGGYATPRTFTATVNGTPASWQWQFSTDGSTFTNVAGATANSLVVLGDPSFTNRVYRAVATFSEGPVIASNAVTFTYSDAIPAPASAAAGTSIASNVGFGVTGGVLASSLSNSSLFVHAGLSGRLTLADLTVPAFSGNNVSLGFNPAPHAGERIEITTTSALRRADGVGTRPRVWEFRAPVNGGPGIFAANTSVSASAATAFALGDLDGDGSVDALVANATGIQRYGNSGNASFTASGPSFSSAGITALATGSLTSTGALDAAAINASGDVEIWTNDGSGAFTLAQSLTGLNARAIAFADMDADGDLDLVLSSASGNQIYLNNGSGAFTAGATFGTTPGKALAIADFDQDGDLDVIVTGGSVTSIWSNNGSAAFTSAYSIPSAFDRVAVADFDANGLPDLALVAADAPATLLRNLGNFQFETLGSLPGGGSVATLAIGDTDSDGRTDLILTDGSGRTGAWLTSAALTISRAPGQPDLAFGNQTELADLNGDGSLDLFGLDSNGAPAISLYRVTATNGNEDSDLTIAAGGFLPSSATIYVRSLPTHGALLNGSTPVTIGTNFTLGQAAGLTYRPAADYNGFDSFTWSATANGDLRTHWILVNSVPDNVVAVADSIALIQGGTATTLVGGATSVLANDSNRDAGNLSASLLDQPTHGTVTLNANGTFTYVHDDSASFTDSFTYRATNLTTGSLDSVTVTIAITRHNFAPDTLAFTSSSFVRYTGQASGITVGSFAATDPNIEDSGLLTFSLVSGDSSSGNADFTLIGNTLKTATSVDGTAGLTRSIRVRVTDSLGASLEQVFSIAFIQPPTSAAASYAINEDSPIELILGGTGGATALNYQIVSLPANGTLSRSTTLLEDNAFVYTPAADFNGTDSFVYRVADSSLSSTNATVSFTIAAVNDTPVLAAITPITIDEDSSTSFTLSGSDAENSPLTYQFVSTPSFGSVQLNGTSVTYTPNPNASGIETLAFTVSDGVNTSEPLLVKITVNAVNDAPVLAAIGARTTIRNQADIFTATITDVDSTDLTLRVGTPPQHGTVVISSARVTYTPESSFTGTDSYTLIARDESLDSAPVTVAVSVNNIATENVGLFVYRGLSEHSDLPSASSGDWNGILPENISTPAHGSITADASGLRYTHNGDAATSDSFTYTLTNSADEIRTVLVSVTISDRVINAANGSASGTGSLGAAIALANQYPAVDWTIRIQPASEAYWFLPAATSQGHGPSCFEISGKVTIDASAAPGFILTTSNTGIPGRHFTVAAGARLTLIDLVLNNGNATIRTGAAPFPNGGSVLNFGTFTASKVSFRNSIAVIGAAIYNDGGTVSLTDCIFDHCFALSETDPGGIVVSRNGSIDLTDVDFTNNTGNANGDLYVFGDAALATVSVSGSTIGSYNLATINGGTLSVMGLLKAFDDSFTRQTGQPLNLTVASLVANDSGGPFANVYVDGNSAKGGTIFRNDGNLTYVPPSNLNGDDSFNYTITNATGGSSTATVKIVTDSKPVGVADTATIYRGLSEKISVLANDVNESGGQLVISSKTSPVHGTATIVGNQIQYAHDGGDSDTDSFTYSISNSTSTTANITVTLSIRDREIIASDNSDSGPNTLRSALETVDGYLDQTPVDTIPLAWTIKITGASGQTWYTTSNTPAGNPVSLSTFEIKSNVIIDATASPGFKLTAPMDGYDPVRNFLVRKKASLTLKNLILLGVRPIVSPFDVTMGGSVLNYGTFIADHVTFQHHTAHLGAAVYNDGGTMSLQDCTFIENIVEEYYRSDAGAGIVASGNGTLTLGRLTFNGGPYNYHPQLYVMADGGTATVLFNTLPNYSYALNTRNSGVLATPGLPMAKDDQATYPAGGSVRIPIASLLANDLDSAGTTVSGGTSDWGFNVYRSGDFLVYEPSYSFGEDDSFPYTITTASGFSSTARVHLTAVRSPNIRVAYESGPDVANGDTVDFGTVNSYGAAYQSFTISNVGYASLENLSLTVDGANPGDYQINGPYSSSLGVDGTDYFYISFYPSANGARKATLHITSNDPDEPSFDLLLTGTLPNNRPAFNGYTASTAYQTAATLSRAKILAQATDDDGDPLTIASVGTSVNGGTVSLQASGILYTPPTGFSGDDTFPITINDGRGGNTTGTITVTVLPSAAAGNIGANTPKLTVMPAGKMSLTFQGIPGRGYLIQRSTDMENWETIATVTAGPTGKMEFIDENPPPGSGFYRLKRP